MTGWFFAALLIFWGLSGLAATQPTNATLRPQPRIAALPLHTNIFHSQSRQFVVTGLPMGAGPVANLSTGQVSYIRVDPALLAVSCERIKKTFLAELEMKDEWVGTISVFIRPVRKFDEPIDIVTRHFTDGWGYHIYMTDQVERSRLIQTVVQVLLQEMANRRARARPAELPTWLVEGMAAYLQTTWLANFTLEPGNNAQGYFGSGTVEYSNWTIKQRLSNPDPLLRVRELLRTRPPLTLNELSFPTDEQLAGENGEVYRACAQLFVNELLRLKNGRACLGRFVTTLPDSLNWQTAFLGAFHTQFQRLLDVDKWWSLNVVHLTSRDLMFTWTREEALAQLDELLVVPASVRLARKELPMSAEVKLQQVLSEWPFSRQHPVLLNKIELLRMLRMRAPQDLMDLVDKYRAALESYLKAREGSGEGPFNPHPLSNQKTFVNEAVRKLNELDAQREKLSGRGGESERG